MNARGSDDGPDRRTTYGDESAFHHTPEFTAAMEQLVSDQARRRAFVRNGIEWELAQAAIRHAANPRDGVIGRCDWLGEDAILLTVDGYFHVPQLAVFAHYEREPDGIHIWLDDAHLGLDALEEEDGTR